VYYYDYKDYFLKLVKYSAGLYFGYFLLKLLINYNEDGFRIPKFRFNKEPRFKGKGKLMR
jgi:hypothetical protein